MANRRGQHSAIKGIEGKTFGRLVVIERDFSEATGSSMWLCRCECGTQKVVRGVNLLRGLTRSCGCLVGDSLRTNRHTKGHATHGDRRSVEYSLWSKMLSRCAGDHPRYGGRGIRVSEAWRTSYATFLADMGRRPSPELTIERVDNNKGYSKENCIWATRSQQARNTRRNHLVSAFGKTQCVVEWAEETGLPASIIRARIRKLGWSAEQALTQPPRRQKR